MTWRDYERDRAAWLREQAQERRSNRFWYGWATLAIIASLALIYACAPAPPAARWVPYAESMTDAACEARVLADSTQQEETR
jgi:hypothetical protein